MPTYEYECKSCGHTFEKFQAMSDDPLKDCPECGKEVRRLIHGGTGVIFKGSGFYVTDKGKSSGAPAKPAKTADTAPAGGSTGNTGSQQSPAASSAQAGSPSGTGGESAPKKSDSGEKAKPAAKTA
jgi:putative FmdB family regulatory protein